jgi:antitoxin HigA-1
MTKRLADRQPTHPGEVLREDVVPALGLSKTEIAARLGVSRVAFYDLLNEKTGVSPRMAVRLGKFLGNGPRIWLNMQTAYDLWHAERSVDTSRIPTVPPGRAA